MIVLSTPVVRFPFADDYACVIFPMSPDQSDDLAQLIRTLVADCVLDRGHFGSEDPCYACASHGEVQIAAGHIESVMYSDVPEFGLRLDLHSWDQDNLDYTQRPTELSLDARLAAAAAVRAILDAVA